MKKLVKRIFLSSILFLVALFLIATIVIFIICTLIEILREKIFRLIYNSKIAKKNRVFYQNYFKKLGLNIEWG